MKSRLSTSNFAVLTCVIVLMQFCCPDLWARASRQVSARPKGLKNAGPSATTYNSAESARPRNPRDRRQRIRSRNFAEVEILLDDQFTDADISRLQPAPGSDVEILDKPSRVKAQIPSSQFQTLYDEGALILARNDFILVEGYADEASVPEKDAQAKAACSGTYSEGSNGTNVPIPEGDWDYSWICISTAPAGAIVTCIDVHYEIIHPYIGDLWVDLTDENGGCEFNLWVEEGGSANNINETETGITVCNGEAVNQCWLLWAADVYTFDTGYIDYWWIKVYYGGGSGGYCDASTVYTCCEHISRVQVGDIDNASGSSGYADYTAYSTQMQPSQSYNITVTNGYGYATDVCGIWVDWNQDEDFGDAGETISVSGSPGFGPYIATITPPGSAVAGETRMRVRIVDPGQGDTLSPCGEAQYGEVEDYTIEVVTATSYCDASASACWGYVANVVVGDIANTSACDLYADYTHLSTQMQIGTPYPITVTDGEYDDPDDRCGIWVDWNRDMDFQDAGEQITVSGSSPTFSATITPPSGAAAGNTCMRIVIEWDIAPQPCGTILWGEVEDYTINIAAAGVMVSGYVQTDALVPVEGVSISASTGESTTTNAAGYYELQFGTPWTGTITPSKEYYVFDPPQMSYSGLTTNVTDADFMATYTFDPNPTISGHVWSESPYGMKDVVVSASSGESTTTDIYGYYELTLDSSPWTGSITPTKPDWTFGSGWYPEVFSDMTDEDYTGTPPSIRYGGGLGTASSPYWISTPEHMQEIGRNPADWDKHFELMQYISLSDYTGEQFNMIGWFNWEPGMFSIPFTGVFDGNGNSISRFSYDYSSTKQEFIGIFSYIDHPDAVVKDLTVYDPEVDGGENAVAEGALVGRLEDGTISNCRAESRSGGGSVRGNHFYTGGLIGKVAGGAVIECYSSVSVSNPNGKAGGLVGDNSGTIMNCGAEADVTGEHNVGGLAGDNHTSGVIQFCYSSGNVSGDQLIGGLVGENRGLISQSYTYGTVAVRGGFQVDIGGLVGRNISGGEIDNCYSFASVSGGNTVGGLVGLNSDSTISNCYSAGSVSGTSEIGGLVGYEGGSSTTNSFWDTETSGMDTSAAGTPKTTLQMQTYSTFFDAGWDFVGETANGTDDIWKLYAQGIYPKLAWESYSAGTGTLRDPYLIYVPEEMQAIGANEEDWGKCFKLMADIDLGAYTGTQFNRIGRYSTSTQFRKPFEGNFDGNGHTIDHFSYTSTSGSYTGIFRYVSGAHSEIRDLTLMNVDIDAGTGSSVGALVGYHGQGIIANCRALGTVSGNTRVGGLVGDSSFSIISDCYTFGLVTGEEEVGGLTGDNYISRLSNCYSLAYATGTSRVGGLAGSNYYTETSTCYAAGGVTGTSEHGGLVGYDDYGRYTNCFWDSTVSPTLSGIGNRTDPNVTGESTANMKTPSTFTNAGWDFAGEMENGPDDDWYIADGGHYPALWWQFESLPPLPPLFAGGTGQPGDPYLIATPAQLNSVGYNSQLMDKHFKLISDIDLAGVDFSMIGGYTCPFAGVFNGDDRVISNFTHDTFGRWLGLFRMVGLNGRVENLQLLDADVGAEHILCWGIGAMAGRNSGTISGCSATGSIATSYVAGGMTGMNYYGRIVNCHTAGSVVGENIVGGMAGQNIHGSIYASCSQSDVSCDWVVGGLVGENLGMISNCYAEGTVSAGNNAGGFVGTHSGLLGEAAISNCYSVGAVSGSGSLVGGFAGVDLLATFNKCFWDITINPSLEGVGATDEPNEVIGETTANMQTQTTFTDAGWDFDGETANGTEDIWTIAEGIDYPRLAWEGQDYLQVELDLDNTWMYQNLPSGTNAKLTATVSITDDPRTNSSYTYEWEFILPDDVSIEPSITEGGTGNAFCTFAAPGCDQPDGLSDSGQTFTVRVTVTGDDYGNTGTAQTQFGIALLGDVNNDKVVNVADRSIVNAFWRLGAAGPFTFTDCNINCDTAVNVADRSIANAVWRGVLGQNSVTSPCPLR